jgi:hypothetical protein
MIVLLIALLAGSPSAADGQRPATANPPAGARAPEPSPAPAAPPAAWQTLEPGLELGEFTSAHAAGGDGVIRILRIDPERWRLRLLNASADPGGQPLTARAWAAKHGLAAAINASMYQADLRSSVSLMRTPGHVNNPRLSRDQAVLAFDRIDPAAPPVQIIDRECQDFDAVSRGYATLVQSIRMVSCTGRNVWTQQPRAWSTAAIGIDRRGRVLFVHARSPHTTHDLIEALLALPIDLRNAMYAEGGHEAQMYVRGGGREYEFVGGADAGSAEDGPAVAWPVPNVIGVVPVTDPPR